MNKPYTIHIGDCREVLATMPEQHFHCCVTSPPYFGLRDYGVSGQIGLEPTPDAFVAAMVDVFRGVWRVLRDDGVAWLNLGDSYAGGGNYRGVNSEETLSAKHRSNGGATGISQQLGATKEKMCDCKPKDLLGIPWRVAFALQADGWYLRDAIIWHKPAPMPGSQRDRCTSSYEFIFQLTKKARYYFDLEAVKEPIVKGDAGSSFIEGKTNATHANVGRGPRFGGNHHDAVANRAYSGNEYKPTGTRTPRNVWKIAHEGFSGAHFATFPRELPMRCIKASTSEKGCCPACGAPWVRVVERDRVPTRPGERCKSGLTGGAYNPPGQAPHSNARLIGNRDDNRHVTETKTTGWEPGCECGHDPAPCRVLDPFNGAGTTGIAACTLGREYDGIELNPAYADMARERIALELNPSTARVEKDEPAPLFGASAN